MKLRHSDRSLIAWALYFCVLMNLFACGLGHGQMMGQQLNGIGGLFCSVDGGQSPISDKGLATPTSSNISNYFACPVCNAVTVALVFLIGLAWLLGLTHTHVSPMNGATRRLRAILAFGQPRASPHPDVCLGLPVTRRHSLVTMVSTFYEPSIACRRQPPGQQDVAAPACAAGAA